MPLIIPADEGAPLEAVVAAKKRGKYRETLRRTKSPV